MLRLHLEMLALRFEFGEPEESPNSFEN